MSAGLEIFNNQRQLSVLAETRGTMVLGRCDYVRTRQPTQNLNTWSAGGSTYTFRSTEPCLFAVECPAGMYVGIIDVLYENGLYTVGVYGGTGPNSAGLDNQAPVNVWAVSMLANRNPKFGLAMWDSTTKELTHDFSIPNLTFPTSSGGLSQDGSYAGLSVPVVLGNSPFYDVQHFDNEAGQWTKSDYRRFLARKAGGVIGYVPRLVFFGSYEGSAPEDSTISFDSPFVVMEGVLLP